MTPGCDRLPGRAFARAGHPVFVLDPDRDEVRYANCCACSVLGYDVDELLALPTSAVFLAVEEALEVFLEAVLKRGDQTTTLELAAKSGAAIHADLLGFRFRSNGQRYVLLLANATS